MEKATLVNAIYNQSSTITHQGNRLLFKGKIKFYLDNDGSYCIE